MNFWMLALAMFVGIFANQLVWLLLGATMKWWAAKKRYEEELAIWDEIKKNMEEEGIVQDTQLDAGAQCTTAPQTRDYKLGMN